MGSGVGQSWDEQVNEVGSGAVWDGVCERREGGQRGWGQGGRGGEGGELNKFCVIKSKNKNKKQQQQQQQRVKENRELGGPYTFYCFETACTAKS